MTIIPISQNGALVSPRSGLSNDMATRFLLGYSGNTRAAYGRDLKAFFRWCADVDIEPLAASRAHVDAYARKLAEIDNREPATVARVLSALGGFYRYALSEDVITRSPAEHVKRPKVGTDTASTGLDKSELRALISAALTDGPRSHALVLLLGLNGLRISEALSIDIEDLAVERGHRVVVINRKGGKRAIIPLAPRTAESIDALVGDRVNGPLFITSSGARWLRADVWKTLRRLARSAVPEKALSLHPHDLRHAFVTLSLDAGATLHDVQDAAGHADPRTTQRYNRARYNLDKHPTYAIAGIV